MKNTVILVCLAFHLCVSILWSQSGDGEIIRGAADEIEYPRLIATEEGTVMVHHPQIESWEDFETMTGWVVIEIRLDDAEDVWIGSLRVEAKTDINFDERLVLIHDISVVDHKFSDGVPPMEALAIARKALRSNQRTVRLDVLIRALPDDVELPAGGMVPQLNSKPPSIFASTTPAELILINGDPILVPIEGTKLQYVVNTNWDLFYHKGKRRWYVLNNSVWQSTTSILRSGWETVHKLPRDFNRLPDDANWSRVQQYLPAQKPDSEPPRLIVSQRPAELIVVEGQPILEKIPGTDLAFVENTLSELFVHKGSYYYLVSGRWFTAPQLTAFFNPVEELPDSFKNIPADHEKAHVLASIQGTPEARAAVIEALIPRKAKLRQDAGKDIVVEYAGEPEFVEIRGTPLLRAANTRSQIIQVGSRYYLCLNAAWFVSSSPNGPWELATSVPDIIYTIPPSDPAHNTTYVYVYDQSDSVVTYGYTSGYHDVYVYYGTVTFGTGYWYSPYVYYPVYGYPYYYPYPNSYGYGAWYNSATGYYGQGAAVYGPYGGAGSAAVYNPTTGTYGRGWAAWDGDEVARNGYAYNPRTNTYVAGNSYYNTSTASGWREGYVQRGDNWAYAESSVTSDSFSRNVETSTGRTSSRDISTTGDSITGSRAITYGDASVSREVTATEGSLSSSRQIQYADNSVSTDRQIDESGAQVSASGSQGGSLEMSRERGSDNADISGTTREGTRFAGTRQLNESGSATTLQSETGGHATVVRQDGNVTGFGKAASGELYAGRNGDVFRQSGDTWQQYNKGAWKDINTSQLRDLELQRNARSSGSLNFDKFRSQQRSFSRQPSLSSGAGAGLGSGIGRRR